MPKTTFLQLPDDKRTRLVDAALFEFTEHGYDLASISRLVNTLGIAKGSIYQYFGDKFALFEYLLQESGRRKIEAVVPAHEVETDVFARLAAMYGTGLQFWRAYPRWAALPLRALEPSREPRLVPLREHMSREAHAFIRGLLAEGQERGQMRADLELETAAHLVTAMLQQGLQSAFLAKSGLPPGQLPDGPVGIDDDVLAGIVDDAMKLLQQGMARPH